MENAETADRCQNFCKDKESDGCTYFTWKNVTKECVLYKDDGGIEYDPDPDHRCVGHITDCLGTV